MGAPNGIAGRRAAEARFCGIPSPLWISCDYFRAEPKKRPKTVMRPVNHAKNQALCSMVDSYKFTDERSAFQSLGCSCTAFPQPVEEMAARSTNAPPLPFSGLRRNCRGERGDRHRSSNEAVDWKGDGAHDGVGHRRGVRGDHAVDLRGPAGVSRLAIEHAELAHGLRGVGPSHRLGPSLDHRRLAAGDGRVLRAERLLLQLQPAARPLPLPSRSRRSGLNGASRRDRDTAAASRGLPCPF